VKTFSRLLPVTLNPQKLAVLVLCAWAVLLGSCSQTPITVTLHALQASGRVSFVCRGDDNSPSGHKLDECPEYEFGTRRLLALVTQTATEEIAVVDLAAQRIVDIDQTIPGYSFLRVGARPGAIVTTPGGAATFVGVSGLEKDGIFALPTTCIGPPQDNEPARDLTTWAACHLSSAPGDISVILDPVFDGDAPRTACPGADLSPLASKAQDFCPADLTQEKGPPGRRKLLVALPEEHKLVLLDAQRLLDQPPGAFGECEVEASYRLEAQPESSALQPILPVDLQLAPGTDTSVCLTPAYPPADASLPATPGGFAVAGDRVYVADRTRPVVHRLDVSDPCAAEELPPLLPYSYSSPDRVVTTSRVAVSPLSPSGQQFVYAIDENDQPTASVMVFDLERVSASDANTRTPLVFPGAARQPYLPADRLRFSSPVRDVTFVMRDFPKPNPGTGVGEFGLTCDPDPDSSGPGTQYQPNSDFTDGARPANLRGVFGFAMLVNGQVAVIDVEDFDAPCRRPIFANDSAFEDFRGCKNDAASPAYFTQNRSSSGLPTVTGESSCRVVEPHRPRSSSLSISSNTNGLRAPSLRTFPQFSNPDPAVVITVDQQPHLTAVDFTNPDPSRPGTLPAQVNVSTDLYAHCETVGADQPPPCNGSAQPLSFSPGDPAFQNSLTLPLAEPRSYAQDESVALTFEGRVFGESTSGFFQLEPGASEGTVRDPDANFCAKGVEDSDSIRARGTAIGIADANLDAWAQAHADYVQITGDVPREDDQYWRRGRGSECAALIDPAKPNADDRDACRTFFGNVDNPAVLFENRDLSIVRAYGGELSVKPRNCQGDQCAELLAQMACCFPAGTAYTVRASRQWILSGGTAGLHDLALGPDGRCVHTASCDRRKQYYSSRAFEVCQAGAETTDGICEVGNPNVGCVADAIPITPQGPGSECIFENLTSRFVVYRGALTGTRGMNFTWQTTGGFVPQTMSLLTQSSAVNPQSMSYLPELGYLAVIDGSTLGLSLFDLDSLSVLSPSPYY